MPSRDVARYEHISRAGLLPGEKPIPARIAPTQINEAMNLLADGAAVRGVIVFDHGDKEIR
ncbi:hypothetical protein ABZ319_09930 [Nocardia sp. NPDC005978]|uniref:hypothetical protein n=1 Tax=Nocardia sp. NPDC005978 TaxID=3156725 RepID=UPI0033A0BB50